MEQGEKVKNKATNTQVLFPSKVEEKQKWDEGEFVSFLNLFKTLNVNLPLIELIEKAPKYAKFLKEFMSRHKKIKVGKQVKINASCNVIISKKVP